eukprot:TRINITY_DN398_c0_g1_i1.p1 TRINITY_DN398_c0_g1~~TRINITY_DN398_c0_g1_i1.p1  ORF type:complete len:430 (+),score=77.08 TRINITY_DN398_c0_g1_i1:65-1354(+)
MTANKVEHALEHLKSGGIVVVTVDTQRENEGELIIGAHFATPEKVAFFMKHTSGILCPTLSADRASFLNLPLMVTGTTDPQKTASTISCDHKDVGNGVSAVDRAKTIRALADPTSVPSDFTRPGHVFPLIPAPGGVLARIGHSEAAYDLCKLAGFPLGVGLISELMNEDGSMMQYEECQKFSQTHNLPLISVTELVQYRKQVGSLPTSLPLSVEVVASCVLPIQIRERFLGEFNLICFLSLIDHHHHVVLVKGDVKGLRNVPARVHSECFTGNILGSLRCDCGPQLENTLTEISEKNLGIVIYVSGHEGRGIGLVAKIKAYKLQSEGLDTYQANRALGFPEDTRNYETPRQILQYLGVQSVQLLTNNPEKVKALGDIVESYRPVDCPSNQHNSEYLKAKYKKQGDPKTPEHERRLLSSGKNLSKLKIEH